MSDDPTSDSDEPTSDAEPVDPENVPAVVTPPPSRMRPSEELLEKLVDVERRRIASADKRTDIMRLAIQSNDDSDKRQFDYRMAKLNSSDRQSARKDGLAKQILIAGVTIGIVFLAVLLFGAFFGTDKQSEIALKMLQILGSGLGGYGVITAITRTAKRFFDNKSDEDT